MPGRTLTETSRDKLAELIAEKRHRAGWTQEELARRLGVSINTVEKWEQGATVPSRMAKKIIKQVLNLDIDKLVERGDLKIDNWH
ncbi:helix-turn-helix transcriptional regulator [Candidatus Acetothermia bacterium]|nr:helix-turn-helix transcriptional regulator [Candidatus Acetothermia bacterium]MBI3460741.1 helix-turn-helix transcriptional regulator [Candidatus Acetothermia bacterium]